MRSKTANQSLEEEKKVNEKRPANFKSEKVKECCSKCEIKVGKENRLVMRTCQKIGYTVKQL